MGEKYCTLLPESPFSAPSNVRQEGSKPSKILTRHRVPSRAKFGWFFTHFAIHGYQLLRFDTCRMRPDSSDFAAKSPKRAKKHAKRPVLGQKTSDYFGINIRTFPSKPPYFVAKKSDVFGFPAEKRGKIPDIPLFPDFAIFGAKASRGGFRGHSQRVNDGVMKAELNCKQTLEKIAHSSACLDSNVVFRGL